MPEPGTGLSHVAQALVPAAPGLISALASLRNGKDLWLKYERTK